MNPTEGRAGSIFWNPAVIGLISDTEFETNLALVGGFFTYDKKGVDPNTGRAYERTSASLMVPNPYFAVSSDLGTKRFRFSYATYFPSGMKAEFDEGSAQRYDIMAGTFLPWNQQITLAYKPIDELTLAVSGIVSWAFFESELDVDMAAALSKIMELNSLPTEHPALASRAKIPMSNDYQFGFALGTIYQPLPDLTLGVSFVSPFRFTFRQKLQLDNPRLVSALGAGPTALGLSSEMSAEAVIHHAIPAILQFGASYMQTRYWKGSYFGRYIFSSLEDFLGVQVESSNLAVLRELEIAPIPRKDAAVLGTTQTFRLSPRWKLGGHFSYYFNSIHDQDLSTTRMDLDAALVGIFARYRWNNNFFVGGEYAHNFMIERNVDDAVRSPNSEYLTPINNSGHYQAATDRLALTVTYGF